MDFQTLLKFYQFPSLFHVPGPNAGFHTAFSHHVSLVSICDSFLVSPIFLFFLSFLFFFFFNNFDNFERGLVRYFCKISSNWFCLMFSSHDYGRVIGLGGAG